MSVGATLAARCDRCPTEALLVETRDGRFLCPQCYNAEQTERAARLGIQRQSLGGD